MGIEELSGNVQLTIPHTEVVTASISSPCEGTSPRLGLEVRVLHGGEPINIKKVWKRGSFLPIRPFYEIRMARAVSNAQRLAGKLSLEAATATDFADQSLSENVAS